MAVKGQPGEHLAAAKELLEGLEPLLRSPSTDVQARATAANAHAVLALAEQVGMVRQQLSGARDRTDPASFQ
jgi:hypothetical protein